MYLPPRKDSTASTGFGERANNFGGNNNNNGFGGITAGRGQDMYSDGAENGNNYDTSIKNTNDFFANARSNGLYYTSAVGIDGSSFNQNTVYNSLISGEGNNLKQILNDNHEYSGINLPATDHNGDGSSTAWTPPNDDSTAPNTGIGAGIYGQNELSSTVQEQRLNKNGYNGNANEFGENTGTDDLQYAGRGTVQNPIAESSYSAPKSDSNQNGGKNFYNDQGKYSNVDPSQQFSKDSGAIDYRYAGPNSFGRKLAVEGGDSSKSDFGNMANTHFYKESNTDDPYNQALVSQMGFEGFASHFNNHSESSPFAQTYNGVNNRNYDPGNGPLNDRGLLTDGSNQGTPTTPTYEQNNFGKSNNDPTFSSSKDFNSPFISDSFSQTLLGKNIMGDVKYHIIADNTKDPDSISDNSGLQSGTSAQNSYGQSSSGINIFDQKDSSDYENSFNFNRHSSLQRSDEQSGFNEHKNGENYSSVGNNEYNQGVSSFSNLPGFDKGEENTKSSKNYERLGPQSFLNRGNFIQGHSNRPANSVYNNQDIQPNGQNDFDQNRSTVLQISNYDQNESQLLSSSSRENYDQNGRVSLLNEEYSQGRSENALDSFGQNAPPVAPREDPNSYGTTESQISLIRENYGENNQNSPTNGDYTQASPRNSVSPWSCSESNPLNQENLKLIQLGAYNGRDISTLTPEKSNFPQYSLPMTANRENLISGLSNDCEQGRGHCTVTSENNSLLDPSNTGSRVDPNYESRNKKRHSTLVLKGQYQNSNLPSQSNFEKQRNDGDYGEQSLNVFSNFAPGNQPN